MNDSWTGSADLNTGIGSWPHRWARRAPESTAWSFEETAWSYRDIDRRVTALAIAFQSRGVSKGDRVAYLGPNHPAALECIFAAALIGAVTVLINSRLAADEVKYVLNDSGAMLLLYGKELATVAAALAEDPSSISQLRGAVVVPDDGSDLSSQVGESRPGTGLKHVPIELDDPCLIMYTSGTTGRPKGAILTHGNLLFNGLHTILEADFRKDEVALAIAPLSHIGGLNILTLPTIFRGGTVIIHRSFDPERTLRAIERHRITNVFAVPVMYETILRKQQEPEFASTELGSLRTVIVGGAPVSLKLIHSLLRAGWPIQQGYGLTETSAGLLKLSAVDAARLAGSTGKPQFFVDVRIVDKSGKDAPQGVAGELIARGPTVFKGYWNSPSETQHALNDGWFHTGDVATQDENGYFYIRDRTKDVFISGGENVYPAEIESALIEIGGIVEAAVIGVKDDRWGEVGVAFVVREIDRPLTESVVAEALGVKLARYKIPKHWQFIDDLPRNPTGKIDKALLRSRYLQALGLERA